MRLGLVSVTFRQLAPREIVDLVKQAGLEAIEWGGDVHVPHGDNRRAQEVRAMTEDAGLQIAAYGSYYRAGQGVSFDEILNTASALNAPTIRIWAGVKSSNNATVEERERIVKDIQQACQEAEMHGMTVSLEYHRGTLTDEIESCMSLVQEVGHDNLRLYWQPDTLVPHRQRVEDLNMVRMHVSHVHVFQWTREHDETVRHELKAGEPEWLEYLHQLRANDGYKLIEFVKDDSPEQFLLDAATLKGWARY
jgi:sugar phosphate isomerase/epimerase